MLVVLVNLALVERLDKRTGLGSLRSQRTSALQSRMRESTYTTSLAQSEAMWAAAAGTPPLASPILRYYSLLQANQAVCASSPLDNAGWQARAGHGLDFTKPSGLTAQTSSLAEVIVEERGNGAVQTLARALNSPVLSQPASLLELIAALPQQSLLTGRDELPHRPIHLAPSPLGQDFEVRWLDPPHEMRTPRAFPRDLPLEELLPALAPFPTLARRAVVGASQVTGGLGSQVMIRFKSSEDVEGEPSARGMVPVSAWPDLFDVWSHNNPLQTLDPGIVLPAVGGNTQSQHPLVTWHLVLYAFSMLARYHGPWWNQLLNYDNNIDAVPMRTLVDKDSQEAIRLVELVILGFLQSDRTGPPGRS